MNATGRVRRAALGLLSALLSLPFVALTPSTASAGELSAAGQAAFQQIASCVSETKVLLASIVVDESRSLRDSDGNGKRASAVVAIIDALAELKLSGGSSVTVEAKLALFGQEYRTLVDWGPVTGNHGEQLRQAARNQLGDSATGTDYRKALNGAQDSINSRAQALDKQRPCSIILWFTDGRLDVGNQTETARDQICVPGGIADSVRAAGTHVVALALFPGDPSGTQADPSRTKDKPVSEKERQQLRATAEGTGDGTKCGTSPIPDGAAKGAYLRAADAAELRRLFAGVGARIGGWIDDGERTNTKGTIAIPADEALAGLRIIFEVEGDGPVVLAAPEARGTVDPIRGTGSIPGIRVASSVRDGLYVMTVTTDTASIAGTWTLRAKPETLKVVDLYYLWGTTLEITAPEGLVQGARNAVVIRPKKNGVVDRPEWFSSFRISATVDGKRVPATSVGDGTFTVPVDLSTGSGRTAVTVGATAEATTAEHALRLGPISSTVKLATRLPVGFPSIEPAALELGRFSQDGSAKSTLTVRGVSEGESQVCLGPVTGWQRAPADATLTLAYEGLVDGCVKLAKGESRSIGLTLTSDTAGDGPIAGGIPATFWGANTDETHELDVPITALMFKPVNEPLRWMLALLLGAGAFVLAWLVGWVARDLTDRYRLGRDLRTTSVEVRLTPDGIERSIMRTTGSTLLVSTEDFESMAGGTQSRFSARGVNFNRRGRWWWPWEPYRAVAETDDGAIATVKGALDKNVAAPVLERGRGAPTSFSPTLHAYLIASSAPEHAEDPIHARLVFLANPDASGSLRARVDKWNADLRSKAIGGIDWPAIHSALRRSLVQATVSEAQSQPVPPSGRGRGSAEPMTRPVDVPPDVESGTSSEPPPDFFPAGGSGAPQGSPPPPSTGAKWGPKTKGGPSSPGAEAPPDYF